MMQHEITTSSPLLDGSGNLREPGYAKRLLPIYRRAGRPGSRRPGSRSGTITWWPTTTSPWL